MTLGAIGSTSSILQTLETKGLSATKAKLVQSDLDASIQSATGLSGAKPDIAAVRGVLDQKIAADVASGALSKDDAAAVSKTLDDLQGSDATASTTSTAAGSAAAGTTATASAGGSKPSGGGGGGGAAEKTEVSRTVVVAGAMTTTTITYSDGSSDTEVTASTGTDAKQAVGAATAPSTASAQSASAGAAASLSAAASSVAADYKPKIVPGMLVDALA